MKLGFSAKAGTAFLAKQKYFPFVEYLSICVFTVWNRVNAHLQNSSHNKAAEIEENDTIWASTKGGGSYKKTEGRSIALQWCC